VKVTNGISSLHGLACTNCIEGDHAAAINRSIGGIGCTLLPGRVRDVFPHKVQLIPVQPKFLMRQTIGLSFLRSRERDPNLLALASVCRLSKQELA